MDSQSFHQRRSNKEEQATIDDCEAERRRKFDPSYHLPWVPPLRTYSDETSLLKAANDNFAHPLGYHFRLKRDNGGSGPVKGPYNLIEYTCDIKNCPVGFNVKVQDGSWKMCYRAGHQPDHDHDPYLSPIVERNDS